MQSKLLKGLLWGAVLMGMSMSAISCSNDDDEENTSKSGVKTCYANVDNQRIEYKYAYLFRAYSASENAYEYELDFYTHDIMYYYQHPEKVSDEILVSYLSIELETSTAYDANKLPVGEIEFGDYYCDIEMNVPIGNMFEENDNIDFDQWYTTDWNQGFASGPLIINKANGAYVIELRDLKLLACDPDGDGDSISSNNRKTTGSFYFEGTLQLLDMGDLNETDSYRTSYSSKKKKTLIMNFTKK